jgi:hypothetical protein
VAVVAASAPSASDAVVCSVPAADGAMLTIAVTAESAVPAAIGARIEVQVSATPAPLNPQLQPVAVGAAANVSPEGSVAVRVGSL